jgi:DNA-binding CsgD family transcriptional regulator
MPKIPSAVNAIARKRSLPALLLFDTNGVLRHVNPSAQRLFSDGVSDGLVKSIRSAIGKLELLKEKNPLKVHSPAGPLFQETVASGRRSYSIKVFLLAGVSERSESMVGVLCERMNPSRMDVRRAQRRFGLSRREVDVVQALAQGMSDKEIASSLGIGFETVREYQKKIRAKLGVSSRTAILSALLLA